MPSLEGAAGMPPAVVLHPSTVIGTSMPIHRAVRSARARGPQFVVAVVALTGWSCSSGDATPSAPSGPAPVASVEVAPSQVTLETGSTAQLEARLRDASGNLLPGRAVTWSSTNTGAATVEQSGLVRGVSAGTTTVSATAEGRTGSASVEVRLPPVARVDVGPGPSSLHVGETLQLTATARAQNGGEISGKSFSWTSSDTTYVRVSQTGLAAALAPGSATVSASTDGVSGNVGITVTVPPPVVVTQISPATLVEGQAATITGSGFGATAGQNTVRVGGLEALITQASPTSLGIVVPAFDCLPARNAAVEVQVGGGTSSPVVHPVSPASFTSLGVGEMALLGGASDRCLQFQAAAGAERYVFGVQSVSGVVSSLTGVTVTGSVPAGASPAPPLPTPDPPRATTGVGIGADPEALRAAELWRDHIASTSATYERERERYQQLADRLGPARAPGPGGAPTVPGTVQEGSQIVVRFPNFSGNTCTEFTDITVRVSRITPRAIFLEDVANPVTLPTDVLDQVGADFQVAYDVLVDHFGDPGDMDGNQRVAIVVTREVNRVQSPPIGFVNHGDRFRVGQCPASNEGELFYMRTADPDGLYNAGVYTLASLIGFLPRVIVHEFVHIVQGARRMAVGGNFMVSWLAEGHATAAEEVVGMHLLGLQQGGNYGRSTVYSTLGGDSRNFFGYLSDLFAYFGFDYRGNRIAGAPEECSWVGNTAPGGTPGPCASATRLLYGLPWTVIKFNIDRRPGGAATQKDVLKALSDFRGAGGLADLEGVFGQPAGALIGPWAAMLYIDDRYPAASDFQLRNFNIRDVASAWQSPNAELVPRSRAFGPFTDSFQVRAGSSAYYEISGQGRPATAVRFRDGSGGVLPSLIQVWVVRVQ